MWHVVAEVCRYADLQHYLDLRIMFHAFLSCLLLVGYQQQVCEWQACSYVHAGDLYLAAMEATNPINPDALFMIKGADQSTLTTNGGQGFITNQQIISESGSSNPNAFFRSLLSKSYSTQVCSFFPSVPN